MSQDSRETNWPSPENTYLDNTQASLRLNLEAQQYLPGGDSRSTIFYGPYPQFFSRGEGCWLFGTGRNPLKQTLRAPGRLLRALGA